MNSENLPISEIQRQARNELYRRSFQDYCEFVHSYLPEDKRWKPYPPHKLICDKLQEIGDGAKDKRLMIFMPPRHGKSMTITETFPSWYLGKNPDSRILEVSYGDSLAQRFGKKNKEKIEEFGERLFGIKISKSNASKTDWDIANHIGGMISIGIGGSATGHGSDVLIVDDPFKNYEEAMSITIRNKVWNEWQHSLLTRLHKGASVIVILTRWHEDDLAGRALNPEFGDPEKWEVIRLPAICDSEDDLIGREIGEVLCPEVKTLEEIQQLKVDVGTRAFTAMFQQSPAPDEGSILKRGWWKYYRELPGKFDEIIQSWDCAFKDLTVSDFVCGQVWGRVGANKYLIDQVLDKIDIVGTLQAIRGITAKYPKAWTKLIEDKANGPAVIQTLKNEISGLIAVNPMGGKVSRARAVSPDIEAGNVYLPSPSIAPWIHDFVEECAVFPNGKNDDRVDAMTQAIMRLRKKAPGMRLL